MGRRPAVGTATAGVHGPAAPRARDRRRRPAAGDVRGQRRRRWRRACSRTAGILTSPRRSTRSARARVTERKGVRGDVLCADYTFDGDVTVHYAAPPLPARARDDDLALRVARGRDPGPRLASGEGRLRCALGRRRAGRRSRARGRSRTGSRRMPRGCTPARKELAEVYAYRWFVVYRNLRRPSRWFKDHPMPGELFFEGPVSNWFTAPVGLSFPLHLREARWMRSPRGVQDTLNAWTANRGALRSYAADPITPAIEFAEHHPLELGAARDAALVLRARRGPQRAARRRRAARLPGHGRLLGHRDRVRAGLLRRGRLGPHAQRDVHRAAGAARAPARPTAPRPRA